MPKNYLSKSHYHGVNVLVLWLQGYSSPQWLTYCQAKALGGNVKQGEKGTKILYYSLIEKETGRKNKKGEDVFDKFPLVKLHTVFNLSQIEGLEIAEVPAQEVDSDLLCENMLNNFTKKPKITFGFNSANYQHCDDVVQMPNRNQFNTAGNYYATLFHELGHSTGHKTRLYRDSLYNVKEWGDHEYSKEELVAEMTSSFLCAHMGIENETLQNSAAYIQSWIKVLRADGEMLIKAASQAQKACDYILNAHAQSIAA